MEELNFWDTNLDVLNGKKLCDQPQSFDAVVYSDASEQGYGGYVISDKDKLICQGQWASDEKAETQLGESSKQFTTCYCLWVVLCRHTKYSGIQTTRTSHE